MPESASPNDLGKGQQTHFEQVVASYLDFLNAAIDAERVRTQPHAVIAELSALARNRPLNRFDPLCGRVVDTVDDSVKCRHAGRQRLLSAAEGAYSRFSDILIPFIGAAIPSSAGPALESSAANVDRRLLRLEAAALGLRTEKASPKGSK